MTSFLERYQQGECVEVWADLQRLGEQIRQEPLWLDALAVARETMRRALQYRTPGDPLTGQWLPIWLSLARMPR